jgi:LuxR family transcriptional regulator, maltose regulon positive regulatory protein
VPVAAFEAEYAAGRALDLTQVQALIRRAAGAGVSGAGVAAGAAGAVSAGHGMAGPAHPSGTGEAVTVLTPRELDVLKLVAQGLSNPDIARRLVLSEHTVHRHLSNTLRKLDLPSRAAAAAWGARNGLL